MVSLFSLPLILKGFAVLVADFIVHEDNTELMTITVSGIFIYK